MSKILDPTAREQFVPATILINDDGPNSILTEEFAFALKQSPQFNSIEFVLPKEERSWSSQAISRGKNISFWEETITCEERSLVVHGFFVDGTPADCAAIGIEHLVQNPEYVFSGINWGTNAGLGFYFNSGTIGAVRQAFLYGVKAAAFSVLAPGEVHSAWSKKNFEFLKTLQDRAKKQAQVSTKIAEILAKTNAWNEVDFFSVNMPWDVDEKTPIVVTGLEEQHYESLFIKSEVGGFVLKPDMKILTPRRSKQGELPGDLTTLHSGQVSVTPICYAQRGDFLQRVWNLQKHF
jgi:5'/3'-nucleotidase SurE